MAAAEGAAGEGAEVVVGAEPQRNMTSDYHYKSPAKGLWASSQQSQPAGPGALGGAMASAVELTESHTVRRTMPPPASERQPLARGAPPAPLWPQKKRLPMRRRIGMGQAPRRWEGFAGGSAEAGGHNLCPRRRQRQGSASPLDTNGARSGKEQM